MDYSALLNQMFVFAVLLVIGYVMAKKKILTPEFSKCASALLVNVFIVSSIINSVLGERPSLSGRQLFLSFAITTLSIVITYVVAFLFCLPLRKESDAAQTEMMMEATNTLFVGLPVVSSLFGTEAVFYMGMSCIPYNLLLFTYGVWRLKKGRGSKKINFRDVLSVPLLASVLALLLFALNLPVPRIVKGLFSTVSGATVPVSMIIIGASLGTASPAAAFTEKRNYLISAERLIIAPVITYLVVRLFTDNQVLLVTCTVIGGVPVGSVATPLSIKYGFNPESCAKATMVTTILSMVTIPAIIKVLFG